MREFVQSITSNQVIGWPHSWFISIYLKTIRSILLATAKVPSFNAVVPYLARPIIVSTEMDNYVSWRSYLVMTWLCRRWKVPTGSLLKLYFSSKKKQFRWSFASSIIFWGGFLFLIFDPFGLPPLTVVVQIIPKTYVWCPLLSVSYSSLSSSQLLLNICLFILATRSSMFSLIHGITEMASSMIFFTFP